MKERIFISLNICNDRWPELRAFLLKIGIVPQPSQWCSFWIDGADPRAELIQRRLQDAGVDLGAVVRREMVYMKKDLLAAELLWLSVDRNPRGDPQDSTAYDRSQGCPRCGTGSKQVGPLRITSRDLPKRALIGQSYTGEIFVADELAGLIIGVTNGSGDLRPLEDARRGTPLPWRQIIPTFRLPRFSSGTTGILREEPCPACDRDGYFHDKEVPFQPAYRRSEFCDLHAWPRVESAMPADFAYTIEHFGNSYLNSENEPGLSVHYAQPLIMVSNRVMKVFLDHKIRGAVFVPVQILD